MAPHLPRNRWRARAEGRIAVIGLIGTKIGMTQVFDEQGSLIPVTVVAVGDNVVVGNRTTERDGYRALILGAGEQKPSRATKPYAGQFADGIPPTRQLHEVRGFDGEHEVGARLTCELFEGTRFVDVIAVSKGKGYQGVMRRHNFGG